MKFLKRKLVALLMICGISALCKLVIAYGLISSYNVAKIIAGNIGNSDGPTAIFTSKSIHSQRLFLLFVFAFDSLLGVLFIILTAATIHKLCKETRRRDI